MAERDDWTMSLLADQGAYRGEYPWTGWPQSPIEEPRLPDAGQAQMGAIGNTLGQFWRQAGEDTPSHSIINKVGPAAKALDYYVGMPSRAAMGDVANPYPESSDVGQARADLNVDAKRQYGIQTGLGYVMDPFGVGRGVGAGTRGILLGSGAGAGSKIIQPQPKMGEVAAPQGIRAYHSSPHDFERFDASKIGTGEGAQVYGHGIYFAENPAVSGQGGEYWKQFAPRFSGSEANATTRLMEAKFNRDVALPRIEQDIERVKFYLDNPKRFPNTPLYQEHMQDLIKQRDLLASGRPVGPRTYEVNSLRHPQD